MLSVKNRGIGISQGGTDTSLMMMKSDPELFVKLSLYSSVEQGYNREISDTGNPIDVLQSAQPIVATPKSFTCINGYTIVN